MTRGKRKLFWIAPLAILGIALFIFIGGEIVMRLWNWLVPMLFGLRQITFWQAIGILGAVPDTLWKPWFSRLSIQFPPSHTRAHGRALGAHDARRARTSAAKLARALRLWSNQR